MRSSLRPSIALFSAASIAALALLARAPVATMQQSSVPFGNAQCSDGRDNDGDGQTDYLSDPECESPSDDDERGGVTSSGASGGSFECSDGVDNDGDGGADQNDFSCSSPMDDDESDPPAACNDGRDNDGDGLSDRQDPGCFGPQDNDESGDSARSTSSLMTSEISSASSRSAAPRAAPSQSPTLIMPPAEGAASSFSVQSMSAASSVPKPTMTSSKAATSVRGYSATESPLSTTGEGAAPVLVASTAGKAYPGSVTIKLEPDSREVRAGSELGFAITVSNHSKAVAGGLTIETAFDPTDFEVTKADKAILEAGTLRWVNGGLMANDTKTLRFTVKVNPDLPHGHVIRLRATLNGGPLSGPASSASEVGVVGSLPAAGGLRLKPLY